MGAALGLPAFRHEVACFATLSLAAPPFFIWYSQEVRYGKLLRAAAPLTVYTVHLTEPF
jgi:hypothetical protein